MIARSKPGWFMAERRRPEFKRRYFRNYERARAFADGGSVWRPFGIGWIEVHPEQQVTDEPKAR